MLLIEILYWHIDLLILIYVVGSRAGQDCLYLQQPVHGEPEGKDGEHEGDPGPGE